MITTLSLAKPKHRDAQRLWGVLYKQHQNGTSPNPTLLSLPHDTPPHASLEKLVNTAYGHKHVRSMVSVFQSPLTAQCCSVEGFALSNRSNLFLVLVRVKGEAAFLPDVWRIGKSTNLVQDLLNTKPWLQNADPEQIKSHLQNETNRSKTTPWFEHKPSKTHQHISRQIAQTLLKHHMAKHKTNTKTRVQVFGRTIQKNGSLSQLEIAISTNTQMTEKGFRSQFSHDLNMLMNCPHNPVSKEQQLFCNTTLGAKNILFSFESTHPEPWQGTMHDKMRLTAWFKNHHPHLLPHFQDTITA